MPLTLSVLKLSYFLQNNSNVGTKYLFIICRANIIIGLNAKQVMYKLMVAVCETLRMQFPSTIGLSVIIRQRIIAGA